LVAIQRSVALRILLVFALGAAILVSLMPQSVSAHEDSTCFARDFGPPSAENGKIVGHGSGECRPNHNVICSLTWIQVQDYQGKWTTPDSQDWGETCVQNENHVGDRGSYAGCGIGSGTNTGIYRVKTRFRALNSDGVIVHVKNDTSNGRVISC
jgi:hypothetical protein